MKNKKLFRILGLALVFSLFLAVIPAAPAFAAETIILNPTQVKVGDRVDYSGTGYAASSTDYYIDVYLSDQSAAIGNYIDTTITRYKRVYFGNPLEVDGSFTGYFNVPTTLNQGTTGVASPLTLTAGSTYHVYACSRYTDPTNTGKIIKAAATLIITAGATLDALSPASGPAGTDVMITGTNFPVSTALVFKIDTTTLTPKSGDVATRTSGIFISTITIPAGTAAGAHIITVTAGTSITTKTFTVTASPALDALVPTSGAAGTQVTVSGTNFPAGVAIVFKFDTTTITPTAGSMITSSTGIFASVITVPTTATAGAHTIYVTVSTTTLNAIFTITGSATTTPTPTPTDTTTPTPTPTTTQPPGSTSTNIKIPKALDAIGSPLTIIGFDFTAGATVTFTYDGIAVSTETADTDGFVSTTFSVPPSAHGEHTIVATDGTNSSTVIFTVESIAPEIPLPLLPAMSDSVKSPVFFDWKDVTDNSAPVTYNLEIATTATFAADSILVQKTGLEKSEYMLSEAEELRIGIPGTTYYWREQAVDAALNASGWTGAGEFTVTQPFKFTGWPLYLTAGFGAVIIFLLGLWVGRRTAFYY